MACFSGHGPGGTGGDDLPTSGRGDGDQKNFNYFH
jgi:hypothetical protein